MSFFSTPKWISFLSFCLIVLSSPYPSTEAKGLRQSCASFLGKILGANDFHSFFAELSKLPKDEVILVQENRNRYFLVDGDRVREFNRDKDQEKSGHDYAFRETEYSLVDFGMSVRATRRSWQMIQFERRTLGVLLPAALQKEGVIFENLESVFETLSKQSNLSVRDLKIPEHRIFKSVGPNWLEQNLWLLSPMSYSLPLFYLAHQGVPLSSLNKIWYPLLGINSLLAFRYFAFPYFIAGPLGAPLKELSRKLQLEIPLRNLHHENWKDFKPEENQIFEFVYVENDRTENELFIWPSQDDSPSAKELLVSASGAMGPVVRHVDFSAGRFRRSSLKPLQIELVESSELENSSLGSLRRAIILNALWEMIGAEAPPSDSN